MAQGDYVTQADRTITWDGENQFVRKGTHVFLDPASPLGLAYGGASNLAPYTGTSGDDADHVAEGN